MIKNILAITTLTAALSLQSSAQCVIDNSYTTPGYYPAALSAAVINAN